MRKVKMLHGKVAVEKTAKAGTANDSESIFKIPETLTNFGIVRFISDDARTSDLKEGVEVFYGPKLEELRILGKELLVMDAANIVATVTDEEG